MYVGFRRAELEVQSVNDILALSLLVYISVSGSVLYILRKLDQQKNVLVSIYETRLVFTRANFIFRYTLVPAAVGR